MSLELDVASSVGGCARDDIHIVSGSAADPAPESPGQGNAHSQRITALGEMTRGIAHDFRNVLAIIESGLRLAEGSLEAPEKARSYLAAAHQGIERGLRLTSQLLVFAKPRKLDLRPEDANELIRKLALFLKYGAGPGIRVRFDLADEIPLCLIEPSLFNAAILNLVVNARDAMPNGGEVTIATTTCRLDPAMSGFASENDWLLVRVTDNGEGMPPETVARIFDPYFTTKGNTGTGLGVPQVQTFVESVGGLVRVGSEPGAGTIFDLLFPAVGNPIPGLNLWRQLDRWTNEGGASRGGEASPLPIDTPALSSPRLETNCNDAVRHRGSVTEKEPQ
jgi:signal transduction histidine kinase